MSEKSASGGVPAIKDCYVLGSDQNLLFNKLSSLIVNNSQNYTSVIDINGAVIYNNPAAYEMLGYSPDESSLNFLQVFSQENARMVMEEGFACVRANGSWMHENELLHKDGRAIPVMQQLFQLKDENGENIGIATIMVDISAQKSIEKELLLAKESAEKASRAKSEFLSRMSHEIRTPLNAIIGMTRMAQSTNDCESIHAYLSRIDTSSAHLLSIINEILDLAKIESKKFVLQADNFNFESMMRGLISVMQTSIDDKSQKLSVMIDPDIPAYLYGDATRLSQVFMNLLSNAVKFTPPNGSITIKVRKGEQRDCKINLIISCRDNGIGISADDMPRIFESFEQLDGGINRKYEGTGLGLVIAKSIVEMMGGSISVTSEPGKGSEFTFDVWMALGESTVSARDLSASFKGMRVLLIDDNQETLLYVSNLLQKLGIRCDTVSNGGDAIKLVTQAIEDNDLYSIVLVDWMMPGMNGIEVATHIKLMAGDSTFIIMISMAQWSDIEVDARRAGVFRFLPKPIFPSALIDALNEAVGKLHAYSQAESVNLAHDFSGRRILMVDDIAINQEIIASLLKKTKVELDYANNGRIAVEKFTSDPLRYDLILMDIQMPLMDGYEAARAIRASGAPNANTIPIIALTANVFKEDVENAFNAGMNSHISKPIDVAIMFAELSKHLLNVQNQKGAAMSDEIKSLPPLPDDLPGINIKEGLGRMRGNKKLYVRLLDSYFAENQFDEIKSLIESGSFSDAAAKCHGIKGVSGNLGLMGIYQCSLSLEGWLKSDEDASVCLVELEKLVARFEEAKSSRNKMNEYDLS